jgi:hypothetical protein
VSADMSLAGFPPSRSVGIDDHHSCYICRCSDSSGGRAVNTRLTDDAREDIIALAPSTRAGRRACDAHWSRDCATAA